MATGDGRGAALRGRRALVTGAASGIGAATARALHDRGAEVLLADVDDERGADLHRELGPRSAYRHLDVTDEAAWSDLIEVTSSGLDILVHSAGLAATSSIADTPAAEFRRIVELNLVGSFLALKAATALVTDGGSVVTLSSINGVLATRGLGAYAASKFGVSALSRIAALELAPRRIRVNAVCPGSIDTPITRRGGFEETDLGSYVRSIPFQRRGRPEEVADAIVWLVGPEAAYVTGTDFVIDGGTTAGRVIPGT